MSTRAQLTRHLFRAAQAALLAGAIATAALTSHAGEWHPLVLVVLLFSLAVVGEWFTVEALAGVVTPSTAVITLAAGLLGPAVAGGCAIAAVGLHSALAGRPPRVWLHNLTASGVAAVTAALLVRAGAGNVAGVHGQHAAQSILFGLLLLGASIVGLALNFALFAVDEQIEQGRSALRLVREVFIPTLPGELSLGVIAVLLVLGYRAVGMAALLAAIPVLLIFRQLVVALIRSERRAEQLDARTRQLATFQWAVPSTFMEGLGLRDPEEMRHSAAVASYAKALAIELGCDEAERESVHLAGLLHDIGKFAWSDRLLHPETLTAEDQAVIRHHPQDGAMMLGKFDGFGPIADAVLYHHERVDGGGYPAGLIGSEIPLASRIVAICSTYDTMTQRDTVGPRMSPEDAIAELRRLAGAQLDGELTHTFIALLERDGTAFGRAADYKTELAFESRVARMAKPSSETATSMRSGPVAVQLRRRR